MPSLYIRTGRGDSARDRSAGWKRNPAQGKYFHIRSGFGQGSVSGFSNFFRYRLLHDRGGWWVDTDVVCLRHFEFPDECVLGTERVDPMLDRLIVSSAVIKQPIGSALVKWAWSVCHKANVETLAWGDVGPRLLQQGVDALGLHTQLRPHTFFSPVAHYDWASFVDVVPPAPFGSEVFAVHLFHQMWRHNNVDLDQRFPESCLYEQLKQRFL
ncbi:MAG: hypothetical protein IPP90_12990 [Gemmatimonadaceae bacterium]|nr:hypothetical protein [Gemmatimonadaceae bacterium]